MCEGEGGFGPYFKLRMQALATRNAEDKKRVGRYLYYMQYLLRLYRQPSSLRAFRVRPTPGFPLCHALLVLTVAAAARGQPDQLAESLEVPEGVAERFMELFADETQEGGRVKCAPPCSQPPQRDSQRPHPPYYPAAGTFGPR